jgi:hypothetical protein
MRPHLQLGAGFNLLADYLVYRMSEVIDNRGGLEALPQL